MIRSTSGFKSYTDTNPWVSKLRRVGLYSRGTTREATWRGQEDRRPQPDQKNPGCPQTVPFFPPNLHFHFEVSSRELEMASEGHPPLRLWVRVR